MAMTFILALAFAACDDDALPGSDAMPPLATDGGKPDAATDADGSPSTTMDARAASDADALDAGELPCSVTARCCIAYNIPEYQAGCRRTAQSGDQEQCAFNNKIEVDTRYKGCVTGRYEGACSRLAACCARLSDTLRSGCEQSARHYSDLDCDQAFGSYTEFLGVAGCRSVDI